MANIRDMLIRARVEQRKPDYTQLRKRGFKAVDMHVHTRYSDTFTRVESILRKARKLGIGVAITDHNEISGVMQALRMNDGVIVIPGIEISTAEGPHVLAYFDDPAELEHFFENYVKPARGRDPHTATNLSIYEIARLCRTYDCLLSLAHPFAIADVGFINNVKKGFIEGDIIHKFDAIEVINGACTKNMNIKAIHYAEISGKSITAGSDSHSLFEMGKVVTYAKAGTAKDFISSIRNNENLVIGKEIGQIKRIPSIAKSSQHQITHPINFVKIRFERSIKREAKYHAPKAARKVEGLKENSIKFIRNPIKTTNSIAKKAITKIKNKKGFWTGYP